MIGVNLLREKLAEQLQLGALEMSAHPITGIGNQFNGAAWPVKIWKLRPSGVAMFAVTRVTGRLPSCSVSCRRETRI
ncbi:hypothetical protein SAMN05428997_103329 [Bosea sp. CRIB-10]|nr:hypothetical protein SAMN05428997_103329 [Bosea sp. CRIB-10]